MNVLELREVMAANQSLAAAGLVVGGATLLGESILQGSRPGLQFEPGAVALFSGAIGLTGLIFGVVFAIKVPAEDDLWVTLLELRARDLPPTLFVAEAEALYAAAVEGAAGTRKRWGYILMGAGLAVAGLQTFSGIRAGQNLRELTIKGLPAVAISLMGVFLRFFYRSPTERSWAAYLNDKNLSRPFASVTPLLSTSKDGFWAGAQLAF